MATDNELLSKFLEEYTSLKKQNQEQVDMIKKLTQRSENYNYTNMSMQNEQQLIIQELNRLKKENQRLLDNNQYLNDQLNQLKDLYSETKAELEESFHFIQQFKKEKQTTEKLYEIFSVNNSEQLLTTAEKIKTVMLGVSYLEGFCKQICQIIFDDNEQNYDLDQAINVVQKYKQDQKYMECFIQFKQQLEQSLQMNTSTDQQILEKIKSLNSNQEIQNIKTLFKISNEDNFMFKMNQIFILLQDIQQFIKIAKRLLDLDENMKNEATMVYILKMIETMKQQQNEN